MSEVKPLILGEFSRKLDDRFRLSLPDELMELFQPADGDCILAKERPGCVSLWSKGDWAEKMEDKIQVIELKLKGGNLNQNIPQLQRLGRLLSTRQQPVKLAGKGRILIPDGFRRFLKVEPGAEVMVVGAAVCLEIWNPEEWIRYTEANMESFQETFASLAG